MLEFTIGNGKVWLNSPGHYVLWVILASIFIRLGMSLLRTIQLLSKTRGFLEQYLWDFLGRSTNPRVKDHLVSFFIGLIELAIYPFLISTGQWLPLGGWLGVKTAAGWRWQTKSDTEAYMREAYMRFLLGNALVILFSFPLTRMIMHGS